MRLSRVLLLSLVVAVASAVVGGPLVTQAWAQDGGGDSPKQKAAALKKAQKFLRAGFKANGKADRYRKRKRTKRANAEYAKALTAFEAAYDVYPDPQIYYAIAEVEVKMGRHLDAIQHYQLLLEEDKVKEAIKDQAKKKIAESSQFVVVLVVTATPEGSAVSVDGKEQGNAPLEDPIYLEPGEHTVAVTNDGYTPWEKKSPMEAGEPTTITVELEKIPVVVKKPKARPKPVKKPKQPTLSKKGLYIGVGTTAALGTVTLVTGLVAVSKQGTFSDESLAQDKRDAARDSGKKYALLSDLFLLGTVGAGVYTAYYYYKVYKPKQRRMERRREAARPTPRSIIVTPYATPRGGGGVAVLGRF